MLFFLSFETGEPNAAALAFPPPLEVSSEGPDDPLKEIVNSTFEFEQNYQSIVQRVHWPETSKTKLDSVEKLVQAEQENIGLKSQPINHIIGIEFGAMDAEGDSLSNSSFPIHVENKRKM